MMEEGDEIFFRFRTGRGRRESKSVFYTADGPWWIFFHLHKSDQFRLKQAMAGLTGYIHVAEGRPGQRGLGYFQSKRNRMPPCRAGCVPMSSRLNETMPGEVLEPHWWAIVSTGAGTGYRLLMSTELGHWVIGESAVILRFSAYFAAICFRVLNIFKLSTRHLWWRYLWFTCKNIT